VDFLNKELVLKAAKLVDEKKVSDIVLLDVQNICTYSDYFLICTASNPVLLRACADNLVEKLMEEDNIMPLRIEGKNTNSWMLIDYGDLIVHIMSKEARDFYNLEGLWSDAKKVELGFLKQDKVNL